MRANFLKALFLTPVVTFFLLQGCSSGDGSGEMTEPTFTAPATSSVTATSATISGEVAIDDSAVIEASGVCYRTSANPTTSDPHVENAVPEGTFSLTITGLQPNTQYYARPYATVQGHTHYGNQVTFTTSALQTYAVGNVGPAGGWVFYVDGTGQHGMEMAPASTQFQTQWGCYTTSVAGTSAVFGQGSANTTKILNYHTSINFYANPAQCQQVVLSTGDVAAKKCADLVFGGYDDWYLPSEGELQLISTNLYAQGIGGINTNQVWISSTEKPGTPGMAMCIQFNNNTTWGMYKYNLTDYRAIRNF